MIVAEAKELKAMDITGTSDPYVVVSIDGEKKSRTPTIFKELNPMWLQEYTVYVVLQEHLL
jgi:Ca2+-dependent lipid-binding protein